MTSKMRVRFCPSPSGDLHLGNAKTALFNYLVSKKYGGEFVFRVEDTDQSRVVENGAEKILAEMKWLGIIPDIGYGVDKKLVNSYTQMGRLESYKKIAYDLVEKGLAYKCYCTQEELDKQRELALAENPKAPFKYPGTCRNLTKDLDKPFVIRFKAPTEGFTEFEDITFGKRKITNKENYDFVLLRANGIPLYNFAVVVDDGITDQITHVIRGSDHIKNMVTQVLIYQALNLKLPVFCHLPMLLGKEGQKLSKRDASVSVADYRKQGYAPHAVLNYLVKFGWGFGNQEIFSLQDMIDKFTLEACHCRDGKFNPTKFLNINIEHLKSEVLMPTSEYAKHIKFILEDSNKNINVSQEQLETFIPVIRSRAKTFVEAVSLLEPMLQNEITIAPELINKTFNETTILYLKSLKAIFCNTEWNEKTIRANVLSWLEKEKLSLKDIGAPLRLALLGQSNSPEIFQVLSAMGKAKSLNRLNITLSKLDQQALSS